MLGVNKTDTCTFSLAIDDSDEANGCLRYVPKSGASKSIRTHKPLAGSGLREESHALYTEVDETKEEVTEQQIAFVKNMLSRLDWQALVQVCFFFLKVFHVYVDGFCL